MLVLGELVAILKGDKRPLERTLASAKGDVRAAGRDMERDADATGRAIATALGAGFANAGRHFKRDTHGKLHDELGRYVAEARHAAGGSAALTGALGDLGGAVMSVGGSFWGFIPILAALAAGAVFAVPAVYALGGALASLPALAVGGGAAIGTLLLGFQGLSEAFQKTARSGGSVVDRAYQVARAERQVRDANREVTDSQLALNRARLDAAERLQDLNRNLASARLDEESAVLAVTEAERDLREARRGGNRMEIQRAELALRQAQQAVLDVRDRVEDLAAEQEDASRKGVEGSDEVTAALRRQERAVEGVQDAQHALAQAQRGSGGGGAAAEATKLAQSAEELVSVIRGLAPEWEHLRLGVQQRLFAGVDREVQLLADLWLPRLETRLGAYASTFNEIFMQGSKSARDPEFVKNIETGLESVRGLVGKVGLAIAGPGVRAWGQLTRAAKPFVDMLGDKLAGSIERFAGWIDGLDQSGALDGFFATAARYLGEIWDLGGDVLGLLGDFFGMWTDSNNGDAATSLFDTIRQGVKDLREWLGDPENKQQLTDIIDGFVAIGTAAMDVIGWLVTDGIPAAWSFFEMLNDGWEWISMAAGRAKDWIVGKWNGFIDFVKGLPGKVTSAASGLFSGIKDAFRSALNWIIDRWNGLEFQLPGFSFFGHEVGGGSIGTPNIPRLDVGGRILQSGLAVVHQDEVVMPAAQVRRLEQGESAVPGTASGGVQTLELLISTDDGLTHTRKTVRVQGGRVDRVLVGRSAFM